MFDIGFSELLVVFVVGLLILGPERLPMAAKTAGLWVRKIRRSIQSVQREINAQLDQEELQRSIKETNERIMRETTDFAKQTESPSDNKQSSTTPTADPTTEKPKSSDAETTKQPSDDIQSRA